MLLLVAPLMNWCRIGKRLFKEGYSLRCVLMMRWTPSCTITYIKSSSLLSRMIANKSRLVASLLVIEPVCSKFISFLTKKCLLE